MTKNQLIRTTQHTTKFANQCKLDVLRTFLYEYNLAVQYYVEYLWSNNVSWKSKDGSEKCLDINSNCFDIPSFISTVGNEPTNTPNLSANLS